MAQREREEHRLEQKQNNAPPRWGEGHQVDKNMKPTDRVKTMDATPYNRLVKILSRRGSAGPAKTNFCDARHGWQWTGGSPHPVGVSGV